MQQNCKKNTTTRSPPVGSDIHETTQENLLVDILKRAKGLEGIYPTIAFLTYLKNSVAKR